MLTARSDGLLVLLHPRTGQYFRLNEVGERVWDLCDGRSDITAIAACISNEFDAPSSQVSQDVAALVNDLITEQLVTSTP